MGRRLPHKLQRLVMAPSMIAPTLPPVALSTVAQQEQEQEQVQVQVQVKG